MFACVAIRPPRRPTPRDFTKPYLENFGLAEALDAVVVAVLVAASVVVVASRYRRADHRNRLGRQSYERCHYDIGYVIVCATAAAAANTATIAASAEVHVMWATEDIKDGLGEETDGIQSERAEARGGQ